MKQFYTLCQHLEKCIYDQAKEISPRLDLDKIEASDPVHQSELTSSKVLPTLDFPSELKKL